MRDVSLDGTVNWEGVVRTELGGRKEPDLLKPGDVLFLARGSRNFAACLDDVPGAVVCSLHFFLIRVRDPGQLLPEFLAWQISQEPAQRFFRQAAEGSDQVSIRRGVLESLAVRLPSLGDQERAVRLANLAVRERQVLETLIENRQSQLRAFAQRLLSND